MINTLSPIARSLARPPACPTGRSLARAQPPYRTPCRVVIIRIRYPLNAMGIRNTLERNSEAAMTRKRPFELPCSDDVSGFPEICGRWGERERGKPTGR